MLNHQFFNKTKENRNNAMHNWNQTLIRVQYILIAHLFTDNRRGLVCPAVDANIGQTKFRVDLHDALGTALVP